MGIFLVFTNLINLREIFTNGENAATLADNHDNNSERARRLTVGLQHAKKLCDIN